MRINNPLRFKNILFSFVLLLTIAGCNNNSAPDVSAISVNTSIGRFDKLLFEKIDTGSMATGIKELQYAFPYFTNDFINNILGLPIVSASTTDSVANITLSELKRFIKITRPLYDSLSPRFANLDELDRKLNQSFKYLKYYFPDYKIPKIVTYIGPFNAPGVAITNEALAIGLQLYAGKDFSFYTSTQGQEIFPLYISRTFEPEYIPANCMKAITQDMYSDNNQSRTLIEQMVERGKQWWLLEKLLPHEPDSIKTGYTQDQLKWCENNEGVIWNFFLKYDYLYTEEFDIIKTYIGEAPNTQGMPDASPGNIGQWVGWQIVKKYAEKKSGLTPDAIMKTDNKKIFSGAKYKPR
ncbi:MAG: hypothetical protein ABIN89_24765 [Chitinophagaceae bacterium]